MIMLAVLVLGLVPMPLLGGRIGRLGELRVRAAGLLFLSIGAQVAITSVEVPVTAGRWLHMATYVVVIPFLWLNRRVPGLVVLFVGAAMNMAAIFANGGVMPASPEAVELAGIEHSEAFENSAPVDGARLEYLGDVFAVPEPVPLANVFSVGDVLIVAGALVLVYRTCGASLPGRRRSREWGSTGAGQPLAAPVTPPVAAVAAPDAP